MYHTVQVLKTFAAWDIERLARKCFSSVIVSIIYPLPHHYLAPLHRLCHTTALDERAVAHFGPYRGKAPWPLNVIFDVLWNVLTIHSRLLSYCLLLLFCLTVFVFSATMTLYHVCTKVIVAVFPCFVVQSMSATMNVNALSNSR